MTTATNTVDDLADSNTNKMSMPRILLHIEGLSILIAAAVIYFDQGFGTLTFIALLLAPDLAFLIYAIDKNMGVFAYNLTHFAAFPAVLIVAGILGDWDVGVQIGLIWAAHIAMDRSIGYGLKYPDDFKHTHLQNV